MTSTITENGALFALQHKDAETNTHPLLAPAEQPEPLATLRTSVGEFAFRAVQFGCRLEISVGKMRRELGVHSTQQAALEAVKKGRTGYEPWDAQKAERIATEIGNPERWNASAQGA